MIRITGLDKLSHDLKQAREALTGLNGELGTVKFDPDDPASIEAAIISMESIIDGRLGSYGSSPFIESLKDNMKEQYRRGILEKASEARARGNDDGERDGE